jgi:hypothetical protein
MESTGADVPGSAKGPVATDAQRGKEDYRGCDLGGTAPAPLASPPDQRAGACGPAGQDAGERGDGERRLVHSPIAVVMQQYLPFTDLGYQPNLWVGGK